MAAHIASPTRSRRFIKVYLVIWAFLALAALGSLSLLVFQAPQPVQRAQAVEPDGGGPTLRVVSKSLAEMGVAVRRGFADVQKDVTHLKEVLVEHEARDKAVQSRLSALEEKVAAIDAAPGAPPAAKAKPNEKPPRKNADARVTPQIINAPPSNKDVAKAKSPIETGSIPVGKEIVFGAPVVTPSDTHAYAIQLAASPSLDGLRQRWGQLVELHGSLAALQPRVVAPTASGGPYRLIAGPVQSKADADRLCADMAVPRNSCFATAYAGSPLQ
jgi:hypothetical protein